MASEHLSTATVDHLSHSYGSRPALRDVTFALEPGSVVGLVGANGSGKSTLLRILAGVQRPTEGQVVVFGEDLAVSESANAGLGAAVDGMALWPSWSVRRNLGYLAGLIGATSDEVESAAGLVDIAHELDTRMSRLSLGNRQRALLAAAVLVGTRIVMLDEPMNGLDPRARERIRDLLMSLAGEGRTVVLSSHDLHDVESLCDRLLVLEEGRLAYNGTPRDFEAAARMTVLRMGSDDASSAQRVLTSAGISCRRDSSGAPVVYEHDVASAQRALATAGIELLSAEERSATLEERFHGRL